MGYNHFMESPKNLDQYNDLDLMGAFWKFFGGRGVFILGWCAVGAMSGTSDAAELRRRLEARGLSKSALYQALDELRSFREHLEGQPVPRRDSSYAIQLANRLASASVL